jgi:hypothetical protein
MINPRFVPLTPDDLKLIPKWPLHKRGGVVCPPIPATPPVVSSQSVAPAATALKKAPDYSLWIALGVVLLVGAAIYFSAQQSAPPKEDK